MMQEQLALGLLLTAAALSPSAFGDVIDVAQETAPGSGAFIAIGSVETVTTDETISSLYAWGSGPAAEYNGSIMIPANDETLLWVHRHQSTGDLSLVLLHDDPDGPDGGSARTIIEVAGDPDGAEFVVLDDVGSSFSDSYPQDGPNIFEANQGWGADRGDGLAIGALNGAWSCEVELVSSSGLSLVSAADLEGRIVLDPTPGRRIRLAGRYGTTESYCPSTANSTGQGTQAIGIGTLAPMSGGLTLEASQLPDGSLGYFLMSEERGFTPTTGDGNICVAGPIYRFVDSVLVAGAAGQVTLVPNIDALPSSFAVVAGSAWNFQYWHRDANPLPTSNTSNGVTVYFQN